MVWFVQLWFYQLGPQFQPGPISPSCACDDNCFQDTKCFVAYVQPGFINSVDQSGCFPEKKWYTTIKIGTPSIFTLRVYYASFNFVSTSSCWINHRFLCGVQGAKDSLLSCLLTAVGKDWSPKSSANALKCFKNVYVSLCFLLVTMTFRFTRPSSKTKIQLIWGLKM